MNTARIVYCLPGKAAARLVVMDEVTGVPSTQTLDLIQLLDVHDRIEEAISRIVEGG